MMDLDAESHIKRGYNILVLEDSPSWQKKFKRFLRDEPFNVNIATNNKEALALFDLYALDLLILDVNLSGVPYNIDGLLIANKLWRKDKKLGIIIVSGDEGWVKRLSACEFVPHYILEKQNLDQDDLVAKIYRVLEYKSARLN